MWVAGDDEDVGERHGFLERGNQLGRYLILSRLGTGGMGVVYAAYDPDLDRKVAIKLLRRGSSDPARRDAAQRRLMQEARAMARLAHPNVITVHDVAEFEGRVFVAMEYVDGQTLDFVLEHESRPWRELLDYLLEAGKGLAAAHAAGVVHRDFKPENVMLDREGRVRVMDFGLAGGVGAEGATSERFVGMSPEDIALATGSTSAGRRDNQVETAPSAVAPTSTIIGTPAYMAPEQHEGRPTDARTDQFSFCVTVYEALHGVRPFAGETPAEIARSIAAGELRTPSESTRVPAWIDAVLRRGLSVRPEARYPSMRALLGALRADPAIRRRRWMARGALGLLILAGAYGARHALLAWNADPCAGASARADQAWGENDRASVRTAFATVDAPYAADAWEVVSDRLDEYAQSWATMVRDACEANKVRSEQSDHLLDLRMQCLSRRLAELDALVNVFAAADEAVVRTAVQATYALVPVAVCADLDALLAPVPPPEATADRVVLDELRSQLAQIKAHDDAGQLAEALAKAAPAVEAARQLDYAPLLAEALHQHGRLAWTVSELDLAEQLLREAVQVAAVGKHNEVEARAWVSLVLVVGYGRAKTEQGQEIEQAATAAVARMGGLPELRAALATARGAVALQRNRLDDAEAAFREALAINEEILDAEHPQLANSLSNVSIVLTRKREYDEARETIGRAIAIYEETFGEAHPVVAKLRLNASSLAHAMGDAEEAQEQANRALQITLRDHGPEHPDTALAMLVSSNLENWLGRHELAKQQASESIRILEPKWGEHPRVAFAYRNLGMAHRELGELGPAVEQLERAYEIGKRTLEDSDDHLEQIRIELAEAYVRAARYDAAVALLEDLLSRQANTVPARTGSVRFLLAQALWQIGRDRSRALELARTARGDLVAPSPGSDRVPSVEDVDRWLSGK